jgi:PDZ domain-containing secreted protein/Zn-dependent protease/CBS domain-containing protein
MQSSFTLFRVRGIPIGANWSWLAVAAFFVFSLGSDFHASDPTLHPSTYIAMGLVTVVLFFGSLILHELGHAFRALREGMQIEGITLWLFGGVAKFKGMFPSAGAEFRIAIAGPVVTAIISAVLYAGTALLHALGIHGPVYDIVQYLASINLILLVFNLIPALPLDGGRVYRSYVWQRKKDFTAATVQAARTSRALSAAMIGGGALLFLRGYSSALWPALIGFFIFQSSKGELAYAQFRGALGGFHVHDIMTPNPETVDINTPVAAFLDKMLHARGHTTYPVTQFGRFVGLVSTQRAAEVPTMDRLVRRMRDVMVPRAELQTTTPDAEVTDVVAMLQDGTTRIVVLDGETIAGIVSPADISRAIQLGQMRPPEPGAVPTRRGFPFAPVLIIAALIGAAGIFIHPPFVVLSPGRSYNVSKDITVSGVKTSPVNGGFYLTSVSLTQPNVFQFIGALALQREIHPLSDVLPSGVDQNKYFKDQLAEFDQSRTFAAAAAAQAAGLKVAITGTGAEVDQLSAGSPAAAVLKVNDIVLAIGSKPVHIADDLGSVIRSHPAGTKFDLTILRNNNRMHVTVASANGVGSLKTPAIGVVLATRDLGVKLPFKVHFKHEEIGGPSAGVAYALAIYDMLAPADLAHGRNIATTGTIDLNGNVGPIGGITEKAAAAKSAGATWFVVPTSEASAVQSSGLHIIGVTTLKQAIDQLQS